MLHKSTTTTTTTSAKSTAGNRSVLNDYEMPTNQWKATTTTTFSHDDDLLSQVADLEASVQLARALDESLAAPATAATPSSLAAEFSAAQSSLAKIIDIQRRTTKNNNGNNKLQDENNNTNKTKSSIKLPGVSVSRQSSKEDHQEDHFRVTNKQTPASTSTTWTNQQQQQHQQPSSSSGKQQSGETLSSFESDYDLLVYLGETETEDIVDTERSLDYQDQTWRQSICGGASLAPTIDESLSELLSASVTPASNQNLFGPSPSRRDINRIQQDLADDLLQQTPSFNSRHYQLTPNTTNYSSVSLPRQPTGSSGRRQTTTTTTTRQPTNFYTTQATSRLPKSTGNLVGQVEPDECDNEVSLVFNEQQQAAGLAELPERVRLNQQVGERHLSGDQQQLQGPSQGQSSLAGNLGKKVVSLFNRKPVQHQTSTHLNQQQVGGAQAAVDAGHADRQTNWNSHRHQSYLPQSSPQIMPTRERRLANQQPDEAAELDRLLAEMSQSLDLDSLARYDPFRGRSAPASGGVSVDSQPGELNARHQTSTLTRRQPNEASIMDEYEGASRMLEQMISDQLGESKSAAASKSRASPASKSYTSNNSSTTASSKLANQKPAASTNNLTRQITLASEPDFSHESSASRKMSTCSSSQATDLSVIPNTKFAGQQQAASQSKPSNEIYENRSVWRYRGNLPLSKGSSLAGDKTSLTTDRSSPAKMAPSSQPTSQLSSKSSLIADQSLPIASIRSEPAKSIVSTPLKWSHSLDIVEPPGLVVKRGELQPRQGSSSPPPPPPAVDYNDASLGRSDHEDDDDHHQDSNVIRVEAAAFSSSDSELDAINKRHPGKVDRMKKRTLSSMRSMRNKLSNLMSGNQEDGATNKRSQPQQVEPKPPKRSSSIGSSHSASNTTTTTTTKANPADRWDLRERVETSPPAQHVARPSRGRERHRLTAEVAPGPAVDGKSSFGQQLRERMSRSKSRFSNFLRPSSSKRRAQSTPDEQRHKTRAEGTRDDSQQVRRKLTTIDDKDNHNLLFQPSDIARNTSVAQSNQPNKPDKDYDSSLERHLKADLRKIKSDNINQQGQVKAKKLSSSASSSSSTSSNELSGLDTTEAPKRVARRRQANGKNNGDNKRPPSLISLKRLSSSFKQKPSQPPDGSPTIEDLDSMKVSSQTTAASEQSSPLMAAAVACAKRKRPKRRNKSTGDRGNEDSRVSPTGESIIKPKLTTTDDYFGLVAPAQADSDSKKSATHFAGVKSAAQPVQLRVEMGPEVKRAQVATSSSSDDGNEQTKSNSKSRRKLPDRSQSLRSMGNHRKSPTVTQSNKLLNADSPSDQVKAVSFSNLSSAINQRRPLPTAANSFRPTSALAKLDTTEVGEKPTTTTSPEPDGRVVTPIRPHNSPLRDQRDVDSQLLSVQARSSGTKSPIRDKGVALMGDFRAKCGKLASKLSIPTRRAPTPPAAPVRPPRSRRRDDEMHRRSKSLAMPRVSDDLDDQTTSRVIEVHASSPHTSLSLERNSTEASPINKPASTGPTNKLSSLASHIKSTATEFFHPTISFDQSASSSSTGPGKSGAVDVPSTSRTSQRQPLRGLDEPTSPDDLCQWRPVIAPAPTAGTSSARGASFRLIRKDDAHPSGTVNRTAVNQIQQQSRSIDTDSTWESGSDDDDGDPDADDNDAHHGASRDDTKSTTVVVRAAEQQVVADGSPDKSDSNVAPLSSQKRKFVPPPTAGKADEQMSRQNMRQSSGRDNFNSNNTSPLDEQQRQHTAQLADINPVEQYGNHNHDGPTMSSMLTADQSRWDQNNSANKNSIGTKQQVADSSALEGLVRVPGQSASGQPHQLNANPSADVDWKATNRQSNSNNNRLNIQQVARHKQRQQQQPTANYKCDRQEDSPGQVQELNIDKKTEKGDLTTTTTTTDTANGPSGGRVEEICKTPFRFNSNLPSPTQVLSLSGSPMKHNDGHHHDHHQNRNESSSGHQSSAIKISQQDESNQKATEMVSGSKFASSSISAKMKQKELTMDEVDANFLKATSHVRAKNLQLDSNSATDNASQQQQQQKPHNDELEDESQQNRLSFYENVARPKTNDAAEQDEWSVENQPTPAVPDPVRKLVEHFRAEGRLVRRGSDDKIKIELDRSQQQEQQVTESKRPPERAQRKLVAMTSIINEPEDELMNISRGSNESSAQPPGPKTEPTSRPTSKQQEDDHRRDSTFSSSEDPLAAANYNSDSESSSFAEAVTSRRRLINKFEQMPTRPKTTKPPNLPKAAPKVIASTSVSVGLIRNSDGPEQTTGARRPAANRGPVGGSLVRRLAKNFDQQGQQEQQQQTKPLRRAAGSVDEEPKSDSTWYDAKSIELLDEAEIAELLRELDEDDDNDAKDDTDRAEPSTPGDDNYVSVGESTLSHGRRDKHPADDGDDEEATTLDDDDTLNDDDDDDGNEEYDAQGDELAGIQHDEETSESVYASAAAASLSQVVVDDDDDDDDDDDHNDNEGGKGNEKEKANSLASERAACGERIACSGGGESNLIPVIGLQIKKLDQKHDVKINDRHDELPADSKYPTDHVDKAQREQLNTCQRQPPASTATTTTTADTTMTRHHQNIDQTFKNSLNNIISLRSGTTTAATKVVDGEASAARRTQADSRTRDGLTNSKKHSCQLAKELAKCYKAIVGHGRRKRSYRPLAESTTASHPTSSGNSKDTTTSANTTIDANDSTVTICNIRPTTEASATNRPQSLSPRSSSTSNSTLSSDEEADDDDDDEVDDIESGDELDAKSIVKAAKKCSRLYEVFEQMLVVRAADEEKKRRLEASQTGEAGNKGTLDDQDNDQGDDEDELSALTELRDDRSSLSSSSMSSISIPEMKQRQNLQKLYHIVQEIYSSEAKFVQTLRLLNVDFRDHILTLAANSTSGGSSHQANQDKLLQQPPYDCVALMLKHLPQLQALNENLLEELKVARDHWPKTQKVSHVLVKIGPFLKHYSSYIREFESIQGQFMDNMKKYPQFSQQVREFETRESCQKLTVQHHLLKPIQRIPQYRLLLQQYLHHLKPDDLDYEDTVNALEVVSRVAEHANQSLNEGVNFAKLLALQAKIVGKQRDIVQPGRLFIKEGELLKVCRKQIQPRWFVLLSDSLLYLTQIQSSDILYLNNEIPLDENCQVSVSGGGGDGGDHDQSELKSETEFNLYTSVRSFSLIAKSRQERDSWIESLRATIEDRIARRRTFSQVSKAGQDQPAPAPQEQLIGRKAPLWTPDSRVTMCQLCTSNFSTLFRRHHCRGCGRVVCSACSSNKAPLIYLKCRAARVCDQCFAHLKANIHLYYLPQAGRVSSSSSVAAPELNNNNEQHLDERELKRLDEYFRTLLKSQFVRHAGLDRLKETDLFTKKRLYLLLKK